MIKFILNRENITTNLPSGIVFLDFLRNHQKLTGVKAADIVQSEISPISDVRGSKDYNRLFLRQLIFAHFIECFGINSG